MYIENHIKFPCFILHIVSIQFKRTLTFSRSRVILFQLPNLWLVRVTSFTSHYYKCLSSIWTIFLPSDYNVKPQFPVSMRTHCNICSRIINSCLFINYARTSTSTMTDRTSSLTSSFISFGLTPCFTSIGLTLTLTIALGNILWCILSNTPNNEQTNFKTQTIRTIRICISEPHQTLSGIHIQTQRSFF